MGVMRAAGSITRTHRVSWQPPSQGDCSMKQLSMVAMGLAFALFVGASLAEEKTSLKSGPQVGEELAGPFHPLNVNGKAAGKKHCLYCENGARPVAMVFAR